MLQQEYVDIVKRLNEIAENGTISEYTKSTICEMANKVLQNLASKYENIIKEVSDVMGGKVLEYEAKTILNEGKREGTFETLVSLVKDGIIALKEAAKRAEMSPLEFQKKAKI